MVYDLTFFAASAVIDSWESVRQIPDYQHKAGVLLFRKLFELDPSAAEVFHFEKDSPFDDDDFYRSEKLVRHAMMFINMLDRALQLLGPDIAMMSEILNELGQKHCKYGVQPHHFTAMGDALMATLQELLGEKFDNPTRDAWCEIYQAMSYDMISARTNGDLFPVHPGRRQSGDIWVIVD